MTPAQIEAIVSGLILVIQLVNQAIGEAGSLTDEEKELFIARIRVAQDAVPDWE